MGVIVPTDKQWLEYVLGYKDKIQWFSRDGGGFTAKHGGLTICLMGSAMTRSRISFSDEVETYAIDEPMPMQAAPLGRWIAAFKKEILRQEPEAPSEKILKALELKGLLNELIEHASRQCIRRASDPSSERKLKARLWDIITEDYPPKK